MNEKECEDMSAADVKLEIPVVVPSLISSIMSLTSSQLNETFWEAASAAVDQSWCKAKAGDWKFGPFRLTPESLQSKSKIMNVKTVKVLEVCTIACQRLIEKLSYWLLTDS